MSRSFTWIVLPAAFAVAAAGCSSQRSTWDNLYSQLSEEPAAFDRSVLEGRRIVIDPGHGGRFRGAVGADSLSEADVNLGVALYLWGLLDEAGAEVRLTRSADRDFLAEGSPSVQVDLAARTALANEWDAEAFISIHHNSNIELDRERNGIEVYYRDDDAGSSLELAEDIHLHLARNLGIEDSSIKSGNYYVLRESSAGASVLGEASYISNPKVEEKLAISTRQRLEAEAYFLGLLGYFSRGVPRVEPIPFEADTMAIPSSIRFRVGRGAGVPVDPSSVRAFLDGSEVPAVFDPAGGILSCPIPSDIPNGPHSARVSARSVKGATARSAPVRFTVARGARFILPLPPVMEEPGVYRMSIRILDINASDVADGTAVAAESSVPGQRWRGKTSAGVFTFNAGGAAAGSLFFVRSGGAADTILFDMRASSGGFSILALDAVTGLPVECPSLLLPDGSVTAGKKGRVGTPGRLFSEDMILLARGYLPLRLSASAADELAARPLVKLTPVLGGALSGRRVAIDPAGGGRDAFGRGPDMLRGATINLELARRIRQALEAAGASVSLTRSGEETLSIHERIHAVNASRADLALGLRYGSGLPEGGGRFLFTHYPSSAAGKAAAESMMETVSRVPPSAGASIGESAEPFLQQTGCPACEIHAGISHSTEKLFRNPRWLEMEASSIVSGLAAFFGGGKNPCLPHSIEIRAGGRPAAGIAVSLDGVFTAVTDESGKAFFQCAGYGPHCLLLEIPGAGVGGYLPFETAPGDSGLTILDLP
ncbi:MAG: N-acetylmuramoyl-L-alanine amidase [Candidatus Krumholzibacteria bacterium]|nr:N-acetylmuramoyl-L-alanine amidase [Candidatus Krumholzibacteria bacterium]